MRYRSKLDIKTSLIFLLPVISSIFRLFSVFIANKSIHMGSLNFLFIYTGILVFLYFGIYYEIKNKTLVISNLFLKTQIPIKEIKHIHKTRYFLSAPALSLDRIKVRSDKKSVVISPERRDEFLSQLKEINPQIKIDT